MSSTGDSTSLSTSSTSDTTSSTSAPPSSTTSVTPPPSSSSTPISDTSASSSIPNSTSDTSTTSSDASTTSETSQTLPPTSTTEPPTSSATSASTSLSTNVSTSGGVVVTQTQTIVSTPSGTAAPGSTQSSAPSKSFFDNTGAVAGVFTVVGLVVLAIFIALLTNAIRRRRAQKFDREIAEAAAEAAQAPAPVFLDDEHDVYGPGAGGGYGGAGQYSDGSHGTYGQQPMSVGSSGPESYGMREFGPGPGEFYDHQQTYPPAAAMGAGAAGIGVARARSTRDANAYAAALADGSSPYPAFAAPGAAHRQDMYNVPPGGRHDGRVKGPGSPEYSLLEAAGIGGGAAVARGPSQQTGHSSLSRNLSQGAGSDGLYPASSTTANNPSEYSPPPPESYASHYQPGFNTSANANAYQPYPPQQPGLSRRKSNASAGFDPDSAYDGYVDTPAQAQRASVVSGGRSTSPGTFPNPFLKDGGSRGHQDYGDESSGEEDEPPRRVLKVANE